MNIGFIVLGIAVAVFASLGQIFFKKTGQTLHRGSRPGIVGTAIGLVINPYFVSGCILFSLSVIGSIYAMRKLDFSVFYSLSALNYLFIAIFSKLMLHEEIDRAKAIGTAVVMLGIVLYVLG